LFKLIPKKEKPRNHQSPESLQLSRANRINRGSGPGWFGFDNMGTLPQKLRSCAAKISPNNPAPSLP
jgi:hypothetical protein